MKVNLREVSNKNEIIKEFSHLHTDRSKVLLWQNTVVNGTKKKVLIYCELKSISQHNLFLSPFNESAKEIIKRMAKCENTLFIRGTMNGVLFKASDFLLSGNQLIIPIPTKILLSERRVKK